jgi:tetratricopeptide (TPR) repeat protein
MKFYKIFIYIIIFELLYFACATSNKKILNENYLEDAREYFKFKEYKKAIESANKVLDLNFPNDAKEEALFIINESAEEIVLQLKNFLYSTNENLIAKEIKTLKEKYNIKIIYDKICYEPIIYYDKSAYLQLKKKYPNSRFIKLIEDRNLSRVVRFVTDQSYRYNQILKAIENYKNLYERRKKEIYAPALLLRIADLYFYLYENGVSVKKELNLSDKDIQKFYNNSLEFYKKLKKEYPNSDEAQEIAYVIDNVKLRDKPSTKAKIIKRLQAKTLVRIIERSEKREAISNMYDFWYKVKLIDGTEGWIYGFYLRNTFVE